MEISNQSLKFHSDALAEDTLLLTRLRGEERLSGIFRFELELISQEREIDLDAVLYQPAKVGILQRLGPDERSFLWFQGALESIQQLEEGEGLIGYRAVLVPDLARLRECHRSRIFQNVTVDELVTEVIKRGLKLQPGLDFDFSLTRTKPGERAERPVYPEREYVVQYEENDLDFVQRWLEHEGIFYLFENDGTREIVRFGDSSGAYKPVNPQGTAYPYRPQGKFRATGAEQGRGDVEDVLSFTARAARQPRHVRLNDYNWRDPSMALATSKEVHPKGTGLQLEYNDHYKTPEQGAALAEVRAQEWACSALVFEGASTCRGFRPGKKFDLDEHYRPDWNRSYLLVSVVHEATQSINVERSNVTAAEYRNTFQAIPADREYRPPRVTPWPYIHGVMHARIDGEGEGQVAELDDHGRYKLRFPFDESAPDVPPGKASRWVRMAQPYAGPMAGMHFTLLKGTEVVVVHIDGDPDRPVIAGALPNPEHVCPTHAGNPTQNQILTVSGNQFQMDDNEDSTGFVLRDASRNFVMDLRMPVGNGNGGSSGGGGGGEPRRKRRPAAQQKPRNPGGTPTDPAVEAELQSKLGGLPPGAGVEDHAAAFRSVLGLDATDEATRRARLERVVSAAPGQPLMGGGRGQPPSKPSAPTGVAARITSTPWKGVKVAWKDGTGNADRYRILRTEGAHSAASVYDVLAIVTDGSAREYLDETAELETTYSYRVVAVHDGQQSDESAVASVTTPKKSIADGDKDGTKGTVEDEYLIGEDTAGSDEDDEYDPRNTQSISLLEDFLNFCDQDPDCDMRSYYTTGLKLLQDKCKGDYGTFNLPGSDPQYQLWARKFNSWLQVAWGNIGEITINNCNQYTYVNNSYEVKFGTGGAMYEEQNGDSNSKKIVKGNQTEYEEVHGNQTKDSYTYGDTDEHETFIGHKVKTAINISTNREATITIGATAKAELELDATASAKFKLGAEVAIDIAISGSAKLDIQVGISAAIEIAAAAEFKIELKNTKTLFEAISKKLSIVIPDSTDVQISKLEAAMDNTLLTLNTTENVLLKTRNELKETKNQLDQTKNQLNQTSNQLSKTEQQLSNKITALDAKRMGLALDTVALKRSVAALQNAQTAALHTIT